MRTLLMALLAAAFGAAQASTLYKCSDALGHTTYTNFKSESRKCEVLSREAPAAPAPRGKRLGDAAPLASASPADFPKVSADVQRNRDSDRRHIVEQELDNEQKNLADARKSLAEKEGAPGPSDMLKPIRDRIALHERNLAELRRELSRLR